VVEFSDALHGLSLSSRAGDWCLAASCSGGSPRCLQDTQSPGLWLCQCASFLFYAQGFETGNDIEQFFVDAILTYTMKCPVEILQQLVDILFGALHRRQAARVLARKDSAQARKSETKRYSLMSAAGRGAATQDLRQVPRRPAKIGQRTRQLSSSGSNR